MSEVHPETGERRLEHSGLRSRVSLSRSLGSPVLFSVIWTSIASAVYFSLGVVAGHALGLTPAVYLVAAVIFALTAMTYVEGASLHQDRGGATVFARYAFNELASFVAGWAILLDYVILIAVTAYSATHYLGAFWGPLGARGTTLFEALGIIAAVAMITIRGFGPRRARRVRMIVAADLALQLLIVVLGLVLVFDPHRLSNSIHVGTAPSWSNLVFALTVTTIAFTSLESASGLAGEVAVGRKGLKRLVGSAAGSVLVVYVGIALVAVTAVPVHGTHTALGGRYVAAPMLGVVAGLHPHVLAETLKYVVAAMATVTLFAAASSAMLGLSRLAYSLSTNRQIPSALGRLHPQRSTPYVLIVVAAVIAGALVVPEDLDFLIGIYAFGAMLAFTIAHVSIWRLRYSEPDRDRPYRVPLSVRVRGGDLPLPAVLGTIVSFAGWIAVLVVHEPARYVGLGWMLGGLTLYVIYRKTQDKPLLRRVTVPAEALRAEPAADTEYGSVLVPLFGTPLDDDIVQTAALLVSGEPTDEAAIDQATIEALWVIEVPMSLPLEARLPDTQFKRAQKALARAKAVGEEYGGVQVATTIRRGRRAGHTIVEEAKRLGVEAIVLGAEEPSRIRGGGRLGGRGGPLENFVGDVTKYVINKAECRVIVTAPPAGEPGEDGAGPDARADADRARTGAGAGASESAPAGEAVGGEDAPGEEGGSAPVVEPSPSA